MKKGAQRVRQGMFLIAAPSLEDPNFFRSVVLVCQHSRSGTLGLVVNRPTTLETSSLFPDEQELWGGCGPLYQGGPVQPENVMVLHALKGKVDGSIHVLDGVSLGGSHDTLRKVLTSLAPKTRRIRLFLGYAGWGKGQLENELAEGSWVLAPAGMDEIFSENPLELWQKLLRRHQRPPGFPGPRQAYELN